MGRHKAIESPEQLWGFFEDYRKYCKDNPILKHDFVGQLAEEVHREFERAMTWVGFENYLFEIKNVITELSAYEQNRGDSYTEFSPTIRRIKGAIQNQQIGGAMAGIFNANLTARLNGLTEKTENKNDNHNTGDISITFKME